MGRDYVDDTDLQTLSETSMDDLLKQLDPYNTYRTAKEITLNNTALQSELEGIGIEFVVLHDVVHVIAPISGGIAAQIGIRAGDKLIKLDDNDLASQGIKQAEVEKALRLLLQL
jgi:carboxyl-terminal processing protease